MKNFKNYILTAALLILINIASGQTIAKNDNQVKSELSVTKVEINQLEINYSGKGLNKFPEEVFAMTTLKQLDLSNNNLTELPKELKNLKHLSVLNLNGNKIYELPSDISRLKFLKEIYLDREIWQYRLSEVKKLTSAKIYLVG
ncbi:MAG: leucine-rich repeat domain-containing protein [Ignavibacteria bacterium]|nr:leucine-rich repeat domain-containing protein [Ignavibacteria bacterium]